MGTNGLRRGGEGFIRVYIYIYMSVSGEGSCVVVVFVKRKIQKK